jgi:hypothetical protein
MRITSGSRDLMSTHAKFDRNHIDLDRRNPSLGERAGPLWRSSQDDRDVGPHRVISMLRPGLFACCHRDRSDRSIVGWRAALLIFSYKLTQLHARLDEQIRAEIKRRIPNSLRLYRLNRLRLDVKDRLRDRALRLQLN